MVIGPKSRNPVETKSEAHSYCRPRARRSPSSARRHQHRPWVYDEVSYSWAALSRRAAAPVHAQPFCAAHGDGGGDGERHHRGNVAAEDENLEAKRPLGFVHTLSLG